MTLEKLLRKNQVALVERWLDRILETYPSRAPVFLKRKKDPFSNPVGHALRTGTEAIVEDLLTELEEPGAVTAERMCAHLDDMIKVRAVQEFSPSQAVSFVFYLKQVIREEIRNELHSPELLAELSSLEVRIDQLALFAFDIYTKCREKMYELRISEIKRTGFRLLKKANLISIDEDPPPDGHWTIAEACRPRGGGP